MSDKFMSQGSYRFSACSTHPLTASWWKGKKDVYTMCSESLTIEMKQSMLLSMSPLHKKAIEYVLKHPKGSKEKSIPCPSIIADYSRFDGPALNYCISTIRHHLCLVASHNSLLNGIVATLE